MDGCIKIKKENCLLLKIMCLNSDQPMKEEQYNISKSQISINISLKISFFNHVLTYFCRANMSLWSFSTRDAGSWKYRAGFCKALCFRVPNCASYNLKTSNAIDGNRCELNNSTLDRHTEDLEENSGYVCHGTRVRGTIDLSKQKLIFH